MKNFTKDDLRAGQVVETANKELHVLLPIMHNGQTCLAMVDDLEDAACQQILTVDPFDENTFPNNHIVKVYDIPKHKQPLNRAWLEVSTRDRDLLWEKKRIVTIIVDNGSGRPKVFNVSEIDADNIVDYAERKSCQ